MQNSVANGALLSLYTLASLMALVLTGQLLDYSWRHLLQCVLQHTLALALL